METLQLAATEYRAGKGWRWQLTDPGGATLADHPVELDPAGFASAGFDDLYRFVRRNADPEQRVASEAVLVRQVGEWIGTTLLGPVGEQIVNRSPVVVRVCVPQEAEWLMFRPWELAVVDGEPLARQDVSLVFHAPESNGQPQAKAPVSGRLRMLAVFSLPSGESMLALRRERYELVRLVRRLRARKGLAIDLSVLQYGVTREKLREAALSGEGWDVLHISGHGLADGLALEQIDGSPDLVTTTDLVKLLRPARSRLKLVVLSSCQSAAATAAETLRWLRVEEQANELEHVADQEAGGAAGDGVPGLGRTVMEALGSAVLAMRFPVVDEFATRFADELYEMLLVHGQTLDGAVRLAVPAAAGDAPTSGVPAISIGTPALFGRSAVGLGLVPPRADGVLEESTAMAGFPKEPARFVGRAEAMARATAALAPDSGQAGVFLHGMAGAGKTTCALELAYRHEDAFAGGLAYWSAPKDAEQALNALPDLAQRLESQLPGFEIVHAIRTVDELERALPRLIEVLERTGRLIVLDNLETLLTASGAWRDRRWHLLFEALIGHRGESRAVFTSRVVPAGLDDEVVLVRQVHALSLAESALLARELPHLGGLLVTGATADEPGGAALVRRTLAVVQGHPKLLELADAAAADLAVLRARLDAAAPMAGEQQEHLRAFFATGESELDAEAFLRTLSGWTTMAVETLPKASRLLLEVLCCVEEHDRNSMVLEVNWEDIWRGLDEPADPPLFDELLKSLSDAALVEVEPASDGEAAGFSVHPGISETVRLGVEPALRGVVDRELATFWVQVFSSTRSDEQAEQLAQLASTAGVAAAPYLIRLSEFEVAGALLDEALARASSPAWVAVIEPFLRHLADVTKEPSFQALHAKAIRRSDLREAESRYLAAMEGAIEQKDDQLAESISFSLVGVLSSQGRLREALAMWDESDRRFNAADTGPWTQISRKGQRLQILVAMGEYENVLSQADELRVAMEELPESTGDGPDPFYSWNVRESVLDTAHTAALRLGRFELALQLNAEIMESKRRRRASDHEIAGKAIGNYGPLIELGRFEECERMLDWCQAEFVGGGDTRSLAIVFSARASLSNVRGDPAAAARLEATSLRYEYVSANPERVAQTHSNLARWMSTAGEDPVAAVGHRVAGAFIFQLAGMAAQASASLQTVAAALPGDGASDLLPATLDSLAEMLEETPGVRFRELVSGLCPDPGEQAATFATLLTQAVDLTSTLPERIQPIVGLVVDAARGDTDAAAAAREFIDGLRTSGNLAQLGRVLDSIVGGARGDHLMEGLDPVFAHVVARVLRELEPGDTGVSGS